MNTPAATTAYRHHRPPSSVEVQGWSRGLERSASLSMQVSEVQSRFMSQSDPALRKCENQVFRCLLKSSTRGEITCTQYAAAGIELAARTRRAAVAAAFLCCTASTISATLLAIAVHRCKTPLPCVNSQYCGAGPCRRYCSFMSPNGNVSCRVTLVLSAANQGERCAQYVYSGGQCVLPHP